MVQINRENYDEFLVGLRVLAVGDDPVGLKIVESKLSRCEFHVTAVSQAILAIKLLREDKDQFDLVISEVAMPDIDGFKRLQITGLEMDPPVIMVSTNCDPKILMKGITHSARDDLFKPIQIEELKDIWQHLLKGKMFAHIENFNGSDDPSAQKKPQFLWTSENQQRFLEAARLSGFKKAAPERILELMNVEGLTVEEVASHLQKYSPLSLRSAETQRTTVAVLEVKDSISRHVRLLNGHGDFGPLTGQAQIGKFNGKREDEDYASNKNRTESDDPSPQKNPRCLWTREDQRKFLEAINIPSGFEKDQQMVPQNLEYFFCKCGQIITLPQYFKFHGMAVEIGTFGTVFEKVVGCYFMGVIPISNLELLFCKKCNQQIGYRYESASNEISYLLFTGEIRVQHGLNQVLTLEKYLPSLLAQEYTVEPIPNIVEPGLGRMLLSPFRNVQQ